MAGGRACNARCPFCVSKMTPIAGVPLNPPAVDWDAFGRACEFARSHETNIAMITSKGEATIWPENITRFLEIMRTHGFKEIELQTNGILLDEKYEHYSRYLQTWRTLGLGLIAISVVHYDPEQNHGIYSPYKESYINLSRLIFRLRGLGFKVRLACIMVKDFIDDAEDVARFIEFAKENRVEQLTVRPVNVPDESESKDVYEWTLAHRLSAEQLESISDYLFRVGVNVGSTHFGSHIFDVGGQNICLTNSLTREDDPEILRQAIFFPNGILSKSWENPEGGRLL